MKKLLCIVAIAAGAVVAVGAIQAELLTDVVSTFTNSVQSETWGTNAANTQVAGGKAVFVAKGENLAIYTVGDSATAANGSSGVDLFIPTVTNIVSWNASNHLAATWQRFRIGQAKPTFYPGFFKVNANYALRFISNTANETNKVYMFIY